MSVLDAVRPLFRELVDGGLHVVAEPFYEVAYDEESSSVESWGIMELEIFSSV
jgi:hypothetical protein